MLSFSYYFLFDIYHSYCMIYSSSLISYPYLHSFLYLFIPIPFNFFILFIPLVLLRFSLIYSSRWSSSLSCKFMGINSLSLLLYLLCLCLLLPLSFPRAIVSNAIHHTRLMKCSLSLLDSFSPGLPLNNVPIPLILGKIGDREMKATTSRWFFGRRYGPCGKETRSPNDGIRCYFFLLIYFA